MTYRNRRYRKRSRSSNGFGGMVGDLAEIGNKFGPKGTLITGVVGFVSLCWLMPWLMALWAEHNKAKMSAGAFGHAMRQLVDEVFIRRFSHPAQWAGIAVLLVCIGIACWKAYARTDLDYGDRRDMGTLAKMLARFLD